MAWHGMAGHLFRAAEVLAIALANPPARGAVVERCAHIDFECCEWGNLG